MCRAGSDYECQNAQLAPAVSVPHTTASIETTSAWQWTVPPMSNTNTQVQVFSEKNRQVRPTVK